MKQFNCPDCEVKMDTCEGCQRYCVKEPKNNISPPAYSFNLPDTYFFVGYEYECCKGCPNNPANGGSGVCNCTLPYFEKGTTYTTTSTTNTTSQTLLINNITDDGENV